ncbi:MAG: sugar phosphate isomerase/epimerase [Tannerellaceae bacterium]|nr:sugar phosphate isomerase/epimerase [Tannerellaceae bacterium]
MQNRRDFLKKASLLIAGGVVAPKFMTSCAGKAASGPKKHIGLQLYSLREMVKDDGIQAVLEAVSKLGYTHVETAGYDDGKIYGLDPKDFKQRLDDLGMRCTSAHLGPDYSKDKETEIMAWWDKAVESYNQVGAKYLVKPSMPLNEKTTADDLKMYCDYYNAVGYKAASASMAFGYHNHAFEFEHSFDGKTGYDFLLDNVSPQHVFFQMDVYWVMMAGQDPAKYLKERARQFKAIHIKDVKEIGASGKMNFQAIFEQMKANNMKDWYVEVEEYTNNNPVESVQQSWDYLNDAAFVY